jgi:peroxiredoxin Q/BCP
MAQLRQDYAKFIAQDTEVIAVGPDSLADFQRFWEKQAMPFIGLADPDHQVARQYDQEVNLLKFGRIPAQMIVDKNGIVQYVHYAKAMSDIPDNQEMLKKLEKINQK